MLLRNLDPPRLCNGTRLVVTNLFPHIVEAEIITGVGMGETVFLPRIPMIPANLPFDFKRVQFPIKPCFAITINKAQGQTMEITGLHLQEEVFSHGQLYVALSRVGSPNKVFALTGTSSFCTKNVVYQRAIT